MNESDQGRHRAGAELLRESLRLATSPRQQAWSAGVLSRSLLLAGEHQGAIEAADRSAAICERDRWEAFLPWPQAVRAHGWALAGDWDAAHRDAEQSYALACQLGDPCWEGMSARALALVAAHDGDDESAGDWIADARRRCDRVPDRWVWMSAYVGLARLELAAARAPGLVPGLAAELYTAAVRSDLPEFVAWSLLYRDGPGDAAAARSVAAGVDSPGLRERAGLT